MSGINCVFFDGRWLKVVKGMKYFLQKFGVKEQEVHSALLSGDPHDQLAIAYHLIIDNKRIADEAAKAELKDFYVASSPPPISFSPSELNPSPIRPHPERIARKLYLWFEIQCNLCKRETQKNIILNFFYSVQVKIIWKYNLSVLYLHICIPWIFLLYWIMFCIIYLSMDQNLMSSIDFNPSWIS